MKLFPIGRLAALLSGLLWLEAGHAAGAIFVVTNTNDSGEGSLRQAISDADGNPGSTITFSIGTGVKTIRPLSALPGLVNGTLDGATQPGYTGTPLIVIDGSLLPAITTCLVADGASLVRALTIGNCAYIGIRLG